MKKLILIVALLAVVVFSFPFASAEEDSYDMLRPTFLSAYFDYLETNFGTNDKYSCVYVSIGMLLSYYDTFLNDDIIPEQYDCPVRLYNYNNFAAWRFSPGIRSEFIRRPEDSQFTSDSAYIKDLSDEKYYDIIKTMADEYFHSYLITIGESLGFVDYYADLPFGLTYNEAITLIRYYLSLRGFTVGSDYDVFIENDPSLVRDFTIEKVKQGYPVMLSIHSTTPSTDKTTLSTDKTDTLRHSAIAYDYDDATDSLYCHFGWDDHTRDTPESQGYDVYYAAVVLDWHIPHSHSNNYEVTYREGGEENTYYYCYDDPDIITYNYHENHSYTAYYRRENPMYHRAYCVCGEYELQNHYVPPNPRPPYYRTCIICGGYAVTRPPIMEYSLSLSALPDEAFSCHSAK